MSVQRYDLNLCIGCRSCVDVCPMDVFRFNEAMRKSVIAYPENCQTCGQCFVYCKGHSLAISGDAYGFPVTSVRAASTLPMNRQLYVSKSPTSKLLPAAVAGMIGAMAVHNVVVWQGKAKAAEAAAGGEEKIVRMDRAQRLQHLCMLVSFLLLVFSGFAIRYAGAWLVHHFGPGIAAINLLHRVAGLMLMGSGLWHVGYIMLTSKGRKLFRDLWPRVKDVRDCVRELRFHLGFSPERAQFGRFSYAEKAEYWALCAGSVSMGLTGTMLWANEFSSAIVSVWWVDLARTIHFYEALLASLTIVVWHFYQVFLDPGVAPMNRAWLSGEIPADQYRRDHPLDTETVAAVSDAHPKHL